MKLAALIVLLAFGNIFACWLFARLGGEHPVLNARFILNSLKYPAYIIAVSAAILAFEAVIHGWGKSALRRLLRPDPSAVEDLFYCALMLSSAYSMMVFLCSLAAGYFAGAWISKCLHLGLLAGKPLAVQFVAIFFVGPFCYYWHHRLMHTRWLWRFHKVHHAATSFNGVTAFRNHPVDSLVATPFNSLAPALFGISPVVIGIFGLFNMAHNVLLHLEIDVPMNWFWKWLLQSPAAHEIHHSSDPADYDRNFSFLPVIDRLFCTWKCPDRPVTERQLGFTDEANNTGRPAVSLYKLWSVPERKSDLNSERVSPRKDECARKSGFRQRSTTGQENEAVLTHEKGFI